MQNLELYKEFYFKEIDRKHELNNSINTPMAIIAGIISLHVFVFTQKNLELIFLLEIIAALSFYFVLSAIFHLSKSFTNHGKKHSYREMNTMSNFRSYDLYLKSEEKKTADKTFLTFFEEELADCSSHNFLINKDRTETLANAKKELIRSILCSILFSIAYVITLII
jgi:hypothetical protein